VNLFINQHLLKSAKSARQYYPEVSEPRRLHRITIISVSHYLKDILTQMSRIFADF